MFATTNSYGGTKCHPASFSRLESSKTTVSYNRKRCVNLKQIGACNVTVCSAPGFLVLHAGIILLHNLYSPLTLKVLDMVARKRKYANLLRNLNCHSYLHPWGKASFQISIHYVWLLQGQGKIIVYTFSFI